MPSKDSNIDAALGVPVNLTTSKHSAGSASADITLAVGQTYRIQAIDGDVLINMADSTDADDDDGFVLLEGTTEYVTAHPGYTELSILRKGSTDVEFRIHRVLNAYRV